MIYLSRATFLNLVGISYDLRYDSQMDQELQAIHIFSGVVDLIRTSVLVT